MYQFRIGVVFHSVMGSLTYILAALVQAQRVPGRFLHAAQGTSMHRLQRERQREGGARGRKREKESEEERERKSE